MYTFMAKLSCWLQLADEGALCRPCCPPLQGLPPTMNVRAVTTDIKTFQKGAGQGSNSICFR